MEFVLLAVALTLIAARDMEDEGSPVVHRCWNCNRPISLSAKRCRHCGVVQ